MGRHAKPWQRAGRDGWWSKIEGRTIRIGDTEREAWAELHRLEAARAGGTAATSPGARLTVPELVDLWLDAQRGAVKPPTWRNNHKFGESFARHCKRVRARDLRPLHVRAWLAANPQWVGCRGLAVQIAKQVTRWARREGWLELDPLQDQRGIPTEARRPAPEGAAEKLPSGIRSPQFAQILEFMLATGCRPGEARTLTPSRIDLNARMATVVGKRGERPILIPECQVEAIRGLLGQDPDSPIFRNTRGEPWREGALSQQFARSRARSGAGHIVAYSCRGIFASRAHAAGADGVVIASLLGHKDLSKLKVLIRHYLSVDEGKLREAVEGAQPANPSGSPPGSSP